MNMTLQEISEDIDNTITRSKSHSKIVIGDLNAKVVMAEACKFFIEFFGLILLLIICYNFVCALCNL